MKKLKFELMILCFLTFNILSSVSFAQTAQPLYRLKSGEMLLMEHVENVSETLEITINASQLDNTDKLKVTIPVTQALTRDQVMARFFTTLDSHKYALLYDKDLDLYRILRGREARDEHIPLITDTALLTDNDQLITYRKEVKHFPAEGVARVLRNISPPTSRIVPIEAIHSVLITDSARSMIRYNQVIDKLDTPEGAKEAQKLIKSHSKEESCTTSAPFQNQTLFMILFSLIALIMGFLARGYLIRRIEGGL